MTMIGIGRVLIFASDIAKLREFYRGLLERDPVDDEPGWVVFQTDQGQLALHAMHGGSGDTEPRTDTAIKYVFVVDDLHQTRARLEALGARLRDVFTYGERSFFDAIDPEGNVFQIASR